MPCILFADPRFITIATQNDFDDVSANKPSKCFILIIFMNEQ